MRCLTLGCQISDRLAEHTGKLVAVAGEARGDHHLLMVRMRRYDKMLVRRERIHTGSGVQTIARQPWHILLQIFLNLRYLFLSYLAIDSIRRADTLDIVEGYLYASLRAFQCGHT